MAKLFVIRCVVPLMVITPTAATTTQKRATSALWRSTKRVSAGIATSEFRLPAAVPPAAAQDCRSGPPPVVPPRLALCRTTGGLTADRLLPGEYSDDQPGGVDSGPRTRLLFVHRTCQGGVAALAELTRQGCGFRPGGDRCPGIRQLR